MVEITECDDHDRDEFWQNTPQDVTTATKTGEQAKKARGCGCDCHQKPRNDADKRRFVEQVWHNEGA